MCTVMLALMKPKVKPRILGLILGRNVAGPESPSSDSPPTLAGRGGGFQPHHSARPCYGPVKDDAQVITALEERYGHTKARVSYINQFEEAMQRSGEQKRSYMCRLQQLASIAFPKLKDEDKRERVPSNSCGACTTPV